MDGPGEEKARQCRDYHVLALVADEEIGLPAKGFRWGPLSHPKFKGQCGLLYRGKPCQPKNHKVPARGKDGNRAGARNGGNSYVR